MVVIDCIHDLIEDIQSYRNMFPKTYTKYDDIVEIIKEREDDPVGSMFGIQVSKDYEDRSYGFEIDRVVGENTYVRYMGLWKS